MHACTQFDACGYVQKIDFCRSIATKKFIRVGVEIYVYPRQQIYRCRVDIQQLLLYMHIILLRTASVAYRISSPSVQFIVSLSLTGTLRGIPFSLCPVVVFTQQHIPRGPPVHCTGVKLPSSSHVMCGNLSLCRRQFVVKFSSTGGAVENHAHACINFSCTCMHSCTLAKHAVLTRTRWDGPSGSRLLVFRGSWWRSMVAVAVAVAMGMVGLRYS